ncbi:MAG: hypothetical protein B7Z37_06110 [Verrucomicrobia bacterium 12-59-8]|nr:MAG: hypothetical protein B7Z37_06110 [Verrucomicrobia bacterium 12-59-8]
MKNTLLTIISALSLVSCATGPDAQTGSVIGALGGAAVGGIIGNQSGRGLEGAAIGAGLGALGGNALGNARDQNNGYGNSGRQQQGYYDNQGRWHPSGPPQQQQQGYYDNNGNYRYY